mmetsp:Transcript_56202/g.164217  ORF Transcript_56202/g.164217 Transcript_56202/m.164217 type:complete len:228 (+) Transcript_56202:1346-2029(+)
MHRGVPWPCRQGALKMLKDAVGHHSVGRGVAHPFREALGAIMSFLCGTRLRPKPRREVAHALLLQAEVRGQAFQAVALGSQSRDLLGLLVLRRLGHEQGHGVQRVLAGVEAARQRLPAEAHTHYDLRLPLRQPGHGRLDRPGRLLEERARPLRTHVRPRRPGPAHLGPDCPLPGGARGVVEPRHVQGVCMEAAHSDAVPPQHVAVEGVVVEDLLVSCFFEVGLEILL